MNDIMDMKISGSSAMPGGEYRLVSISGSGKVQGQPALREPALLRQRQGSKGTWTAPGRSGASGSSRVTRRHRLPGAGMLRPPTRCEGQSPGPTAGSTAPAR